MKKIELGPGMSIDDAYIKMVQIAKETSEVICAEFNGKTITSDESLDSMYLKITGRIKAEDEAYWEQRRKEQQEAKEKFIASIPEQIVKWIAEGHKVLAEDKWVLWDECVPIRLDDLYRGMELGCCLEIIKHINNNDFEKAHTELQSQGHSGMSHALVRSMVKSFHDRGKEFYEFIND